MNLSRQDWEQLGWETTIARDVVRLWKSTLDSRKIKKNSAFFAYDGSNHKGKDFIWQAIDTGAGAVFLDKKYQKEVVKHTLFHKELPIFFSSNFFHDSAKTMYKLGKLTIEDKQWIGITGTNGKTTIAFILEQVINALGSKTGYVGTLGASLMGETVNTVNTSPDPAMLSEIFQKGERKKIKTYVLEASSHGLVQGRLDSLPWQIGIFTNLSQDHLDYHKSMEKYFEAKKILFNQLVAASRPGATAIIMSESTYGKRLHKELKKAKAPINLIGVGKDFDCEIYEIRPAWDGYLFKIRYKDEELLTIQSPLYGAFNVQNLTLAYLAARSMGYEASEIVKIFTTIKPPPGRMEVINLQDDAKAFVDYAHTPDALENVILTLRELSPRRIITIFGCGGDRDKKKRVVMARVAQKFSDFVIAASDNPRKEDPGQILKDVKKGLKGLHYVVIPERELAIRTGVQLLGPKEILLVAGKGHENFQIIQDKKIHFSDKEQVIKSAKLLQKKV